jgi:hypothetical protein
MLTAATMLMPGMKIARAMLEALQPRGSFAVGPGSTRGERVWVDTVTLLYWQTNFLSEDRSAMSARRRGAPPQCCGKLRAVHAC